MGDLQTSSKTLIGLCQIGNKTVNNKTIIHFAHANGFPAKSYSKLFANITIPHDLIAIDKIAHNPRFPLNNNWENQVQELIHFIEQQASVPVVGIGHSFGAVITYMSACLRPDLFNGVILLDPPLITGLARYVFRFAKASRLINKLTPAGITENRVRKWHLEHDLHAYFSSKKLFKDFDPDCIHDYIQAVIEEVGDSKSLNFEVDIEAEIFRTIPDNLPAFAKRLQVPSVLITGKHTDVCIPVLRNPFLKSNSIIEHIEFAKGGHMFPLEYPQLLANLINEVI